MKKIVKMSAVIFSFLLLLACGGGGGEGGESETSPAPWAGNVNAAGYPDVVGLYSMNVSAGRAVCTDGSTGAEPALAMNLNITQTDNRILLKSTSQADTPAGWTILQRDDLDGNVDLAGNFTVDQHLTMKDASVLGSNTLTYTTTGTFTSYGWAGTYQLTIYNDFYKVSCTATASFQGAKIGGAVARNQIKEPPIDVGGFGNLFGQ